MGWVCQAGHFIAVNLSISIDDQRPGGAKPPYGAVCHCGQATWPMIVCSNEEFEKTYQRLKEARKL